MSRRLPSFFSQLSVKFLLQTEALCFLTVMKRSVRINNGFLELIVDGIDFEGLVAYFDRTYAFFIRVSVKTFELLKRQALLFQHIVTGHS